MARERSVTSGPRGFDARQLIAAGLAILVLAAGGTGQVRAQDRVDVFCVRVSDGVAADRLNRQIVKQRVTIRVVPNSECGTAAALDALSDVEHLGVFAAHLAALAEAMFDIEEALGALGDLSAPDAASFLAPLATDADAMAAVLAPFDRFMAVVEDELAWLEVHPPRLCYADTHQAVTRGLDSFAEPMRAAAKAVRALNAEMLIKAVADMEAFSASGFAEAMPQPTCF